MDTGENCTRHILAKRDRGTSSPDISYNDTLSPIFIVSPNHILGRRTDLRRLYHSGIEGIPYTRWTSKRPDLRHLRAFGAHVSVRRTGHRPTKADPHYYSGRFLRFGATEKNLIYLDTHTLREKTARHCTVDEFHFGTPAAQRPHGAQTESCQSIKPRMNTKSPSMTCP
jgi:hypothetical protein